MLDHSDGQEFKWLRRFSKEKAEGFYYRFEVFKPWLNQVVKHSIFDDWDKVKIRGIGNKVSWRFTSYDEYKKKNLEAIEAMRKHHLKKQQEEKEKKQKEQKEKERKRKERERKRRERKERENENAGNHNDVDPSPSGGNQQASVEDLIVATTRDIMAVNGDVSFDVNAVDESGQSQRKRKRDAADHHVEGMPPSKKQRTDPPADDYDAPDEEFLDQFVDEVVGTTPLSDATPCSASLSQISKVSPIPVNGPRMAQTHPLHDDLKQLHNTSAPPPLQHNLYKDTGYDKEKIEAKSIINECYAKAKAQSGATEIVCLIPLVFL